jgi:hypothetical protein
MLVRLRIFALMAARDGKSAPAAGRVEGYAQHDIHQLHDVGILQDPYFALLKQLQPLVESWKGG